MGFGDIHHRARVSTRNPAAFGVCDRCGGWFQRNQLIPQMEWYGNTLRWTGWLVDNECLDKPQPQLKPIVLPPDPIPVVNPRPENFLTDFGLQGFTEYVLYPYDAPPTTQAGALAQIGPLSKIPVPSPLNDHSAYITLGVQTIMPANPARSWVAIYNPSNPQISVSLNGASFDGPGVINLGPGMALFWATAQGTGQPYTGAIYVAGSIAGVPFFAWDY